MGCRKSSKGQQVRQKRGWKSKFMAAALAAAITACSVPDPLVISGTLAAEADGADHTELQRTGSADNGVPQGTDISDRALSQSEVSLDNVPSSDTDYDDDVSSGNTVTAGSGTQDSHPEPVPDQSETQGETSFSSGVGSVTEGGVSYADSESASPEPDAAIEPGTGTGDDQDYLSAVSGNVELTLYRQEEECFPAGMTVQMIPAKEMVTESDDVFREALMETWTDTVFDACMEEWGEAYTREQLETVRSGMIERITMFETYYIRLEDASGNEVSFGDMVFDFHIRDSDLYAQVADNKVLCAAGRYIPQNNSYVLAPDNGKLTVVRHEEEKYLTCSMTAGGTGFFSLLAIDSSRPFCDPEGSSEAMNPETGGTAAAESAGKPEQEEEISEGLSEEELFLEETIATYASENMTPSGTRITESGTGYTIVNEGDRTYSSAFFPIRVHANSTVSAWNSAGGSVKVGDVASGGAKWAEYLLPDSLSAAGKFGYRVTNVAYNTADKCYVDLYLTVNNYNNYTYNSDGEKVSEVYPYLGVSISGGGYISFIFNPRLPMMEVKCDLVKSGTTTPVTGNYRLRMLDVDSWQRFAIGMQNGSCSGKYALSGSQVYVGNKTAFGHTYHVFNGNGVLGDDDPMQSVVYELKDTGGFYLLFQIAYRNDRTISPTAAIRRVYEEAMAGSISSNAVLNWDGEAYGAAEVAVPVKYVSDNGTSLGTSNTLPTSTSSYYYTIEHFVPEESSKYYYASYKVCDDLPAGVKFDGAWRAVQLESGADVTGWFSSNSTGKHIEFNAGGSVLAGRNFYGHHYRFTFKVKMEPSELTPVYGGNSASYSVKNAGYVTVSRGSGPSGTEKTNTVTTTATEARTAPEAPFKGIEMDRNLTTKKYGSDFRNQDIVFSVFQKIPSEPPAWAPAQITVTDVLQDVLEYVHCEVYLQKAGDSTFVRDTAWKFRADGQTLEETRACDASLAGSIIRWDITCRVKEGASLDGYYQVVDGVTWAVVPNTAETRIEWTHGSPAAVEQTTNKATVLLPVSEMNVRVAKTNEDTGEQIPNAVFTIYEWDGEGYNTSKGKMEYRETQGQYSMDNLPRTSVNEGRYKIVETVTPCGYTGTWEQEFVVPEGNNPEPLEVRYDAGNPMSKGTITISKRSRRKGEGLAGAEYEIRANKDVVSPQGRVLVKGGEIVDRAITGEDGKAASKALYPGEYLVAEVKAPPGYALDADPQVVAVVYQDKDTPVSNTDITFVNERLYATLELTKEIDAEDIVWAHGNPVFTFKVEGSDVLGAAHTYYDTVEFTRENVDMASGKAAQTVSIRVLAGEYTVSENATMRYALADIHSIRGGVEDRDGRFVAFNLQNGGEAAAAFYNVKTTDEDESHTAIVRNRIVE